MKMHGIMQHQPVLRAGLLCAILMITLVGCRKQTEGDSPKDTVKSMTDLVIPDNFQWKMTALTTFLISGIEGQIIEIRTADGSGLLHKSIIESGKTETIITLCLPTYMTGVLINRQKIALGPGIINVSTYSLKSLLTSVNKAIGLDGTDDAVRIGNYAEFSPGTGAFTCEAWINTTDRTPDPWARKIVSKGLDYGMYVDPADGKVRGYINNVSTLPSVTSIDDGNWHHVAFKRSGTTIKIFIDGTAEREDNNPAFGANLNSTDDFKIGAMHEGSSTNSHWHGQIDEVRCWNTARTAVEIHDNYDKKVPGSHPNLQGSWDCDEDIPTPGYIKDRTSHGHDGELENGCSPIPTPIPALDSDGDGVKDDLDDYPSDPLRAFNNYFPAVGEGTLAFEDLWPSTGDYDCNDLVLGYRFKTVTNASNKVVEIIGTFVVRAVGASMDNGFGFQLPDAMGSLLTNLHVTGYDITSGLVTLDGTTHLETGQTKPVVIVYDNAHKYMPGLANTIVGYSYYTPTTLTLTMTVPSNTYVVADLGLNTWNPFLISNQDRGREVHLINHPPTDLANLTYLGTHQDAADPAIHIYYQTSGKLPWGLDFPEAFDYPVEYTPINQAYLHFVAWAESGGISFTDWYKNTASGYRDTDYIYTH